MKAHEAGICAEVSISSGGFIHVCALQETHSHDHECACGQIMEKDEIDCVSSRNWVKEYQEAKKR